MRLVVEIQTNFLPAIYRNRIMSLIKGIISKQDEEYYSTLYQQRMPKSFTFGIIIHNGRPEKKMLMINNEYSCNTTVFYPKENDEFLNVSLIISSIDDAFILALGSSLKRMKHFEFSKDNLMLVDNQKSILHIGKITFPPREEIKSNQITIRTNTPIVITDNYTQNKDEKEFLFPENPNFNETLNIVMDKKLKTIRGYGLRQEIQLIPIAIKQTTVPHFMSNALFPIKGSEGMFALSGHPKDLEECYYMGIGMRTGQGFGMVSLCQL